MVRLFVNNSYCQVEGLSKDLEKRLKEELRYTNQAVSYTYHSNLRQIARIRAILNDPSMRTDGSLERRLRALEGQNRGLFRDLYKVLFKDGQFPTGLLPKFKAILDAAGCEFETLDQRKQPAKKQIKFVLANSFPLMRYYQRGMSQIAMEKGRGICVAPTGTGKTLTVARIIWEMGVKTLIITPNKAITDNMFDTLTHYFSKSKVAKLNTKSVKTKDINVVNIQALIKLDPAVLKGIDMVIIDEFHHCLKGSSEVYTDQGVKSIRDIVKNRLECKVLSYNETTKKHEYKKVVGWSVTSAPTEMMEIEYEVSGKTKTLTCTPDHEIFTKNRGYVCAKDLTSDDDIEVSTGLVCACCETLFESIAALGGHIASSLKPLEQKQQAALRMISHKNWNGEAARKLNSLSKLGDKNPSKRLEVRAKKSVSQRAWFDSLTEDQQRIMVERFQNAPKQGVRKGPTKLEQRIIELQIPGLLFTGNGKLWLTSENRKLNPDFKFKNQRKVLEVGDDEYWHTAEDIKERIRLLNGIKFECLYLTSSQLKLLTDPELISMILAYGKS